LVSAPDQRNLALVPLRLSVTERLMADGGGASAVTVTGTAVVVSPATWPAHVSPKLTSPTLGNSTDVPLDDVPTVSDDQFVPTPPVGVQLAAPLVVHVNDVDSPANTVAGAAPNPLIATGAYTATVTAFSAVAPVAPLQLTPNSTAPAVVGRVTS
tara:strand:- start:117 stop:581 length:465 start_codon:yes stop_codon:yes gene_type:complete